MCRLAHPKLMKKAAFVLSLILLVSTLGGHAISAKAQDTKIYWGLSGYGNEQTPSPPTGAAEMLSKYGGMYVGDTAQKNIYLTFDLGYEAGHTAAVLDILKSNDIRAIFFLCSHYLGETQLVDRMISEGHTIGNHTDRHKDLPTLSEDGIREDIQGFDTKYKESGHTDTLSFFRPPCGTFDERTLRIAKEEFGLSTIMWSIAIKDWGKTPIDAVSSSDTLLKRIHPGAIILLHISNAGTPPMLERFVNNALSQGYSFGTPCQLSA